MSSLEYYSSNNSWSNGFLWDVILECLIRNFALFKRVHFYSICNILQVYLLLYAEVTKKYNVKLEYTLFMGIKFNNLQGSNKWYVDNCN